MDPVFNIDKLVVWDDQSEELPGGLSSGGINVATVNKDPPGSPLTPDDFKAADYIKDVPFPEFTEKEKDPIELAQLFEGDIDNVHMSDLRSLRNGGHSTRNAIRDSWRKWPGGVLPYIISNSFSQYERSVIAKAMKQYKDKTCIRFKPRTNEKAYLHIMKGSGCSSSVGRTGSVQTVSLGSGCVYTGIVIHELMHAVGFWHEQSRNDRDSYIKINWSNIMKGMEYNFLKYDLRKIDHLGATYDQCSVMHYGAYAFSKGRSPTIVSKVDSKCKLGQRDGFSDTDIRKINTLYQCEGYKQTGGGNVKPTQKPKPKPEPVQPKCIDENKYCATWAEDGECEKNPEWMLKGCPVACKQCKIKCDDNNVYCKDWAKADECTKNPQYMNIYCRKACNKCSGSNSCKNTNKNCDYWAEKGYCTKNKNYMSLRCKESCGLG